MLSKYRFYSTILLLKNTHHAYVPPSPRPKRVFIFQAILVTKLKLQLENRLLTVNGKQL